MNFLLFGPPGIGKSTIIGILKTMGVSAIDLEDLYPSRERFVIPNVVDGTVLGAADLNNRRTYHNAKKVLLTAKQEAYAQRRAQRDRALPNKAQQQEQFTRDWEKATQYDLVIDTTDKSAKQVAQLITKFILKGN